jgi:hypothetical protein
MRLKHYHEKKGARGEGGGVTKRRRYWCQWFCSGVSKKRINIYLPALRAALRYQRM